MTHGLWRVPDGVAEAGGMSEFSDDFRQDHRWLTEVSAAGASVA